MCRFQIVVACISSLVLLACDRCKESTNCEYDGLCATPGSPVGECYAAADADCERSLNCKKHGRCSERGGKCVLASSADCQKTGSCHYDGECTKKGDRCVVGSKQDCESIESCRLKKKRCDFQPIPGKKGEGVCVTL